VTTVHKLKHPIGVFVVTVIVDHRSVDDCLGYLARLVRSAVTGGSR
jgi:hypothetical protein